MVHSSSLRQSEKNVTCSRQSSSIQIRIGRTVCYCVASSHDTVMHSVWFFTSTVTVHRFVLCTHLKDEQCFVQCTGRLFHTKDETSATLDIHIPFLVARALVLKLNSLTQTMYVLENTLYNLKVWFGKGQNCNASLSAWMDLIRRFSTTQRTRLFVLGKQTQFSQTS